MIGEALAFVGALLLLLSAVGVIRFEDALARMHALAKGTTLGLLLLLAGAAVNIETVNDITSVVLAGVLHVITSPPAANMVSRAVYRSGGLLHEEGTVDEGAEPLGINPPNQRGR